MSRIQNIVSTFCSSVGAAEQADLRDVRRTMARQTALAFDRLDHRRFFAADVGAGAAAQMQLRVRRETGCLDLGDFVGEHQPQFGIFVANIDIRLAVSTTHAAISMPSMKRCGSRSR